jgi:hypothetical protein
VKEVVAEVDGRAAEADVAAMAEAVVAVVAEAAGVAAVVVEAAGVVAVTGVIAAAVAATVAGSHSSQNSKFSSCNGGPRHGGLPVFHP